MLNSDAAMPTNPAAISQTPTLRSAFESHLALGYAHLDRRDFEAAMAAFEVAHILGQRHTLRHLRSHIAMLRWGWRAKSGREIAGQLSRLLGAALFTWLWVPLGNPGSSRVGTFTPQPIPDELIELLRRDAS